MPLEVLIVNYSEASLLLIVIARSQVRFLLHFNVERAGEWILATRPLDGVADLVPVHRDQVANSAVESVAVLLRLTIENKGLFLLYETLYGHLLINCVIPDS